MNKKEPNEQPKDEIKEEPNEDPKKTTNLKISPEMNYGVTNSSPSKPTRKGAFRDMQEVKGTEFADDLKKANCCSRLMFCYANRSIRKARENKFVLTDEMIMNMNTAGKIDGEEESYMEIKQFWK